MGTIFVARSKALSQWGYDVGLGKHIYKVGYTDEPVKDVVAAGWTGDSDWVLVKKQDVVGGTSEDEIFARVANRAKLIDPRLNPRIRDATGIFKVVPAQVENHLLVARALAGEGELKTGKIGHAEIADYLIAGGLE